MRTRRERILTMKRNVLNLEKQGLDGFVSLPAPTVIKTQSMGSRSLPVPSPLPSESNGQAVQTATLPPGERYRSTTSTADTLAQQDGAYIRPWVNRRASTASMLLPEEEVIRDVDHGRRLVALEDADAGGDEVDDGMARTTGGALGSLNGVSSKGGLLGNERWQMWSPKIGLVRRVRDWIGGQGGA
ncbi:unnamed protein product [Choristocarpus tenellus]